MKIYLDDIQTPLSSEWIVCRSFVEFVAVVSSEFGSYETPTVCDLEITFDHDLATDHYQFDFDRLRDDPNMTDCEKSGYDCAKWLIGRNIILKTFWVHSANPVGTLNILYLLNNWYKYNGMPEIGYRRVWEIKAV